MVAMGKGFKPPSDAFIRIHALNLHMRAMRASRLLLLNASGQALASIQEEWWSKANIEQLQDTLQLPIGDYSSPIRPAKANALFPGAASFWLRHRLTVGTVMLCVLLLVAFVIIGSAQ